jgi:hypothetical protein
MTTFSRVYDNYGQAQRAVRDLEALGVDSDGISIVANQSVTEEYDAADDSSATSSAAGLGAAVGGGAGLLAGLGMMAIPGLGPVVAAGWLASTALGAAAGAVSGGIIGALVDAGTSEEDAHVYSEAVRRGGTLVTVRTNVDSERVQAVLDGYSPVDPASRRAEYQQEGWQSFDPDAPPYTPAERSEQPWRRIG